MTNIGWYNTKEDVEHLFWRIFHLRCNARILDRRTAHIRFPNARDAARALTADFHISGTEIQHIRPGYGVEYLPVHVKYAKNQRG